MPGENSIRTAPRRVGRRIERIVPAGPGDRDPEIGGVLWRPRTVSCCDAAGDPTLRERTWVLLSESPEGGWGIAGHANTNADITQLARRALAGG